MIKSSMLLFIMHQRKNYKCYKHKIDQKSHKN